MTRFPARKNTLVELRPCNVKPRFFDITRREQLSHVFFRAADQSEIIPVKTSSEQWSSIADSACDMGIKIMHPGQASTIVDVSALHSKVWTCINI